MIGQKLHKWYTPLMFTPTLKMVSELHRSLSAEGNAKRIAN